MSAQEFIGPEVGPFGQQGVIPFGGRLMLSTTAEPVSFGTVTPTATIAETSKATLDGKNFDSRSDTEAIADKFHD